MKASRIRKFIIAATLAPFVFALGTAFVYAEDATVPASEPSPHSLSVDAVYANAFKKARRGGVDMGGLDARWNYDIDGVNRFSVGLLLLGGSENIGNDTDLDTSNVGLLAGYRFSIPFLHERLKVYAGVRVGMAWVDYVLDYGRTNGWDNYSSDSDFCAVYAGELGLSYALNAHWSIRGGYELYGNTAKIGGGDTKFKEQRYHLFQLGAEYCF